MTNVIHTEEYPDYEHMRQRLLALEAASAHQRTRLLALENQAEDNAAEILALQNRLAELEASTSAVYELVPDEQGYRLQPAQRSRLDAQFMAHVAAFIPRRHGTTDPAQFGALDEQGEGA